MTIARIFELHRDERGTISILTTFAMLMFTMLLLLIMNVALQVDDKVKMQNAADAAAYSGGVVIARGMNAIAFANHLEADVFAVTAFLREARDRNAASVVPQVLQAWLEAAAMFGPAQFPKFIPLPAAIPPKAAMEQELVDAWSEMAFSAAEFALPVFEYILGTPENEMSPAYDHLIPNFQRTVVATIPQMSYEVAMEVALRHGLTAEEQRNVSQQLRYNPQGAGGERGPQYGVLWQTGVYPVGWTGEEDPMTRSLPVVDPDPSGNDYHAVPNGVVYLTRAQRRRNQLAHDYLNQWINDRDLRRGLGFFGDEAKMSQFQELFRIAACGQLDDLLYIEYPTTNVPFMLRSDIDEVSSQSDLNRVLEKDYTFVGVAYRKHVDEMAPRMYTNPSDQTADAMTFSQITLFIPRSRYLFHNGSWVYYTYYYDEELDRWIPVPHAWMDDWSNEWSLFNQNWMVKLVPATAEAIPEILETHPGGMADTRPPDLGNPSIEEINAISTH
jgi:hypothetical protein